MAISITKISQELKNKYLSQSNKPNFRVGDILKIERKLENRRHTFTAICIGKNNNGASSSFTVLNHEANENDRFELTLFTYNPDLKYEIVSTIKNFKKSKLYYLRHKFGKASRIRQIYSKNN
jgi:large subunit ribosomal protein L19